MNALLAINEVLDPDDYSARPKLAERMRALTLEPGPILPRARKAHRLNEDQK